MRSANRFLVLGGMLACGAGFSCGDGGGDDPPGGGTGAGGQDIEKVAMALTGGVEFENGAVVAALLPDPSNDTVQLDQASTTLSLAPGAAEILPLEVNNPEAADTQVEAALLQFEGADEHIEVTVDGTEDELETFELGFTVGTDICDALCNEVVRLKLMQAVRMTDGTVSEHLERVLELDCSDDGDPDACAKEEPADEPSEPTEQPSGGSGGGSGTTSLENVFATTLIGANNGLCTSCPELGGSPCDAIYPRDSIDCIKTAIAAADDAESVSAINALRDTLVAATQACNSCDMTTCPTSLLADQLAELPTDLGDAILECTGPLPPESSPSGA